MCPYTVTSCTATVDRNAHNSTTKVTESLQNCAMKLAVDCGGHDDVSESLCSNSDLSTQMDYYFAPYKDSGV